MSNPIKNILNKEMSRKDFLKYTGLVLLSFTGTLEMLNRMSSLDKLKFYKKQTAGYGSTSYGGKEKA